VPFGNDGNFARSRMVQVINSELANNIGNLVQRVLSMIHKNCGGRVPDAQGVPKDEMDIAFLDKAYVTKESTPEEVEQKYTGCKFHLILEDIVAIASEANNYIDTKAPWKQKKADERLMRATLYYLAESIRCIAIMIQPFMPGSASKILDQLAIPPDQRLFGHLKLEFALRPGTALPPPQPVFPRISGEEEGKGEAAHA